MDERPNIELPDLSAEFAAAGVWMQQYFLSSIFHCEYSGQSKLYAESIIARIQMIFASYQSGRTKLQDYANGWAPGQPGISRYLAAIAEWESVFLNLQIIYSLFAKYLGMTFTVGDRENRSRMIANRIKHVSEDIEKGKVEFVGLPLWLEKNGFGTNKANVTFHEICEEVRLLALFADCLSIPSKARERFAELDKKLADDPNYQIAP